MKNKGLVGFKLDSKGLADPAALEGNNLILIATVCFTGKTLGSGKGVTIIQIGDHVFSVPNPSLEKATQEADESIGACLSD